MSKKKKAEEIAKEQEKALLEAEQEPRHPVMSPGLYWEWRCTLEEMKTSEFNKLRIKMRQEILNRDVEILKQRLQLSKHEARAADEAHERAKDEYKNMKRKIEKEMGISFDNCAVDPITFEVISTEELERKVDV
jgi:hypothetical protein